MSYRLDPHGEELMEQYYQRLPIFKRIEKIAFEKLSTTLAEQDLYVTSLEHRIKEQKSLAGKLELKGGKYASLSDITDILGIRIITFYSDDVDKVAAIVKSIFDIDWQESIDKRKQHQLTSFGYSSLHYICRLPKQLVDDPTMPELNEYRFEIQMRTALQHVWSTIEHDTGYKAGVKIPPEYRRQFSRLSGMLELIDDEFSRLRTDLTEYHRQIKSLVSSGQLDEVPLDNNSFKSFLKTKPFEKLNHRIAASNQAEIYPAPLIPFLRVLEFLEMNTLGDVQRFITENSDDAYQLAISQIALTDLDILSENIGILNLCIVYALKRGMGQYGLKRIYDILNGEKSDNQVLANLTFQQASALKFMQSV